MRKSLFNIKKREGFAAIIPGLVLIVLGGAMLLVGVLVNAKLSTALDPLNGGSYINTTDYCTGGWNTTDCDGTITPLPSDYTPFNNVSDNILDALELGGVVLIIVGVVLLISALRNMGA